MLDHRIARDGLARARLSHAIRTASGNDVFFISSANLDALAQRSLPNIEQQMDNLVRWLGAQLGDDFLGKVESPSWEELSGLIGSVDGQGVKNLVRYACKEGLIAHDSSKRYLSVTPYGWKLILGGTTSDDNKTKQTMSATGFGSTTAHCNKCGGDRDSFVRASHKVDGSEEYISWFDKYEILECCGCHELSVRHTFWFSEWEDIYHDPITGELNRTPGTKITYWPPRTMRQKPIWIENIDDSNLRDVFGEVYQALDSGLEILAAIGTRTLLDRAMTLCVGDIGGFTKKLANMENKGHIGAHERETLETITDAGSAAAHRGFSPQSSLLGTILDTVEGFVQREFILKKAAGKVKAATPSRDRSDRK